MRSRPRSTPTAAGVDEKYIAATGANGLYPMMYYTHNVQFESAAAMFAGNFAEAHAAAQRTVKFVDPIADQMVMIEPFAAQDLTVLVRFGQWQPILEAKPPAPTRLLQTALYHFAHGAALAATGKAAEAEADLAAIKAAVAKMPKDAMVGPANSAPDVAAVAIADLGARIAEAKGDTAAAIKGFTAAVEAGRQARLQRAARLVASRARTSRCCSAQSRPPRRGRKGVPRRSREVHRQPAIVVRALPCARGPEEARRHRDEGRVREGLGKRRRDTR